ncbi:MAG TPA: ABC transporter substrate-binding protein [Xanthomonadales bacterium]
MKLRVLFALALFSVLSSMSVRAQADDPVSLVENITGHIFADVTKNLEEYTANPQLLEDLVRKELIPLLDVNYAARLILGRAGRGIEQEKVDEFANCMSNLLISRYSKGLLYFSSKIKLQVLPQRGELDEKLTRVRTRVTLPEGGEAPIDYAFHKTAEGWKAFDVVVEGISYITTYRNQIMPEVQANGIDSVIERLNTGQLQLSD